MWRRGKLPRLRFMFRLRMFVHLTHYSSWVGVYQKWRTGSASVYTNLIVGEASMHESWAVLVFARLEYMAHVGGLRS